MPWNIHPFVAQRPGIGFYPDDPRNRRSIEIRSLDIPKAEKEALLYAHLPRTGRFADIPSSCYPERIYVGSPRFLRSWHNTDNGGISFFCQEDFRAVLERLCPDDVQLLGAPMYRDKDKEPLGIEGYYLRCRYRLGCINTTLTDPRLVETRHDILGFKQLRGGGTR